MSQILVALGSLASACSLLAPSDDTLLGGGRTPEAGSPRDSSGGNSDRSNATDSLHTDSAMFDGQEDSPASGDGAPESGVSCTDADGCAAGSYCSVRGVCESCGDIASLDLAQVAFGEPQSLTAINAGAGVENLRFPRAFDAGSKLLYEREFFGGKVWLSPDLAQSEGAPLGFPIDDEGSEGSPLKVEGATGPLSAHNFFFQRNTADAGSRNELYGAKIDASGTATDVTRLPAPFNAPQRWSKSLALSSTRAFWTVDLDGALNVQLWTAPLETGAIPSRVSLITSGCTISELEYSAWVTFDGQILIVSYTERTASCEIPQSNAIDIGIVRLNAAGQAEHPVRRLSVSQPGIMDVDGSLSPDLCWLYFASNRHTSGNLRLYRARRSS